MIDGVRARQRRALGSAAAAAGLLALAACGSGGGSAQQKAGAGPGGQGGGPAKVGYVEVQPTAVPNVIELAARTVAFQSSQVRPQVSGVIQRRLFAEGTLVRQGQPLYQIDPSLYRAAVNQARANIASAQANAEAARVRAERYKPLAEIEAVSKQDYTDSIATQRQAEASIALGQAQLETARTNLRFATVPAPITGRIGRSLFTVGALVSATQTDPLATIQQLDPMFVDIQQSSAALIALRRSLASGGATPARAAVRLKLEDGSDYGRTGTVEFSEVVVDPATGTVTLRARFPNPDGMLLPGMFVRAVFSQSIQRNAFLVPQAAVQRDAKGQATLYVVGANNKAEQRDIVAPRTVGASWVVTDGVKAGDKVITQGTANLRPQAPLAPVRADSPQPLKPPSPEQMKAAAKSKGQ